MAKCPSCGSQLIKGEDGIHYSCPECGRTFKKKSQQANNQQTAKFVLRFLEIIFYQGCRPT